MLSGPPFRSVFVFSFNSLILSGFLLNSFHLAEASLSVFSWLYTLVCANLTKCLLFIIVHIFSIHFAINLYYLHNLKINYTLFLQEPVKLVPRLAVLEISIILWVYCS